MNRRRGHKGKVNVARIGLHLLQEKMEREVLRKAYADASEAVRKSARVELAELDTLANEGLDET